jgi:cell division protein FtsI (penicillin-binding protein 3)
VVFGAFVLAFSLITYRLVSIQGLGSRSLQDLTSADVAVTHPAGLRGSILASDGDELAFSQLRPTVFADPYEIRRADAAGPRSGPSYAVTDAVRLAPVLHLSEDVLLHLLTEHPTHVVLAADVSQKVSAKVTAMALVGVGVEQDPVRVRPDGALAAPLIGSVDSADVGYSGLESEYDGTLTGRPGTVVQSVDLGGDPIPGSVTQDTPAVNGRDVLTTIDEALQYQTEQALAKGILAAGAPSGTAVVMDRRTAQLLAVASMVRHGRTVVEAPSEQAFTSVYEPGSVSKIITLSAALEQGDITPSTELNIPDELQVAGTVFHDAEVHPDELLTPTGILAQSSNIGAIQVAERLGPTELSRYLAAYGLTSPTDVGFPGESSGQIPSVADFSGTTLPTLAYGVGYDTTAVQMAAAINTIANGGVYVAPELVTATVGADGRETLQPHAPDHRVVPQSVATTVTHMLEQVVAAGTGTAAAIPHYAVAGKTGTGPIYSHRTGAVVSGHYVSSFAGFTPAEDPDVTALVVIDDTNQYGAEAAAPVWATITHDALLDRSVPSTGRQPAPSLKAMPIVEGRIIDPSTGGDLGPAPAGTPDPPEPSGAINY